jgi:hypothetical protein
MLDWPRIIVYEWCTILPSSLLTIIFHHLTSSNLVPPTCEHNLLLLFFCMSRHWPSFSLNMRVMYSPHGLRLFSQNLILLTPHLLQAFSLPLSQWGLLWIPNLKFHFYHPSQTTCKHSMSSSSLKYKPHRIKGLCLPCTWHKISIHFKQIIETNESLNQRTHPST